MRQSSSSAWSATPNSEHSWSMSPPGTPGGERPRPSSAVCATSRRSPSSSPPASASASVSATESAELDDSPEPGGTRRGRPCRRSPTGSRPTLGQRPHDAGDEATPRAARPSIGSVAPVRGHVDRAGSCRGPEPDPPVRSGAPGDHALPVDRQRQAEAVVVVRVVADQVHPARRTHPDHGGTLGQVLRSGGLRGLGRAGRRGRPCRSRVGWRSRGSRRSRCRRSRTGSARTCRGSRRRS